MTLGPSPALVAASFADKSMAAQPFRGGHVPARERRARRDVTDARSTAMDRRDRQAPRYKDRAAHDKGFAREGEEYRRKMDRIPAPGTDPLQDGPSVRRSAVHTTELPAQIRIADARFR